MTTLYHVHSLIGCGVFGEVFDVTPVSTDGTSPGRGPSTPTDLALKVSAESQHSRTRPHTCPLARERSPADRRLLHPLPTPSNATVHVTEKHLLGDRCPGAAAFLQPRACHFDAAGRCVGRELSWHISALARTLLHFTAHSCRVDEQLMIVALAFNWRPSSGVSPWQLRTSTAACDWWMRSLRTATPTTQTARTAARRPRPVPTAQVDHAHSTAWNVVVATVLVAEAHDPATWWSTWSWSDSGHL